MTSIPCASPSSFSEEETSSSGAPRRRARSEDATEAIDGGSSHNSRIISHPEDFEKAHVHDVYNTIAPHFSCSRYRPWPRVSTFLASLPRYALIADVGCGNGKYFAAAQKCVEATAIDTNNNKNNSNDDSGTTNADAGAPPPIPMPAAHRYVLGMDYSAALLQLTQREKADPNFDVSVLPVGKEEAKPAPATKRGGGRRGGKKKLSAAELAQRQEPMPRTDVMQCDVRHCPVRPGCFDAAISIAVIHHYATAERRAEAVVALLQLVRPDGGLALIYVWAMEQPKKASCSVDVTTGDAMVRWEVNQKFDAGQSTLHRYYHLFRKGELEELCVGAAAAAGIPVCVKESYYDQENWCVVLERTG